MMSEHKTDGCLRVDERWVSELDLLFLVCSVQMGTLTIDNMYL